MACKEAEKTRKHRLRGNLPNRQRHLGVVATKQGATETHEKGVEGLTLLAGQRDEAMPPGSPPLMLVMSFFVFDEILFWS